MKEFYFAKKTHFFWPPREQQIISNNTLQGTESYTCLLQALGQTHPWSNSTDANGGSSIANLKRSKVTSQAGKKKPNKKNLKNQEIAKEPKRESWIWSWFAFWFLSFEGYVPLGFCYSLLRNSGLVAHESWDSHLSTHRRELRFRDKQELPCNL